METVPYKLAPPIGARATLGLIVLQTDETIEHDFRRLFADRDIALYVSRVPSGDSVTPDTLRQMETDLPASAALFPPATRFDVIGYGCTSGATMIGSGQVAAMIRKGAETREVTNPLAASTAALAHLGAARIAIVSPYIEKVARPVSDAFARAGFDIVSEATFGEETEERVARIDPASIRDAARSVTSGQEVDAVFLSCTNLRTLDIIDDLENELGVPILSSNQALAWHMSRLAGEIPLRNPLGQLFRQPA